MENLIFSLNATVPIFLLMVAGLGLRRIGIFDENFISRANTFVFKVTLPCLMFMDLAEKDFSQAWDGKFVLFCFCGTLFCIGISCLASRFLKDETIRGEFVQASYRSSSAVLGIAFITNIYGDAGMATLMIIGTVPLYNAMAVTVLSLMKPGAPKLDMKQMKKTLIGIATNPIILGIAIGLLWSVLHLPVPKIVGKTLSNIGGMSTPLGLMAMGAAFEWKGAMGNLRTALVCAFLKLVGFSAVLIPLAVAFGFRDQGLVAILIMSGSATTVVCYVMAKSMGHKGVLTSSVVMLTTLLAAFTLTGWLFVLKTLALI